MQTWAMSLPSPESACHSMRCASPRSSLLWVERRTRQGYGELQQQGCVLGEGAEHEGLGSQIDGCTDVG